MDCSPKGLSVHGVFRQKYWSGLPFPPPRDLPDPGLEPTASVSSSLQAGSLPWNHWGSPKGEKEEKMVEVGHATSLGVRWIEAGA